ncbi:MAG TPA: hypothetical protein PLP07_10420 [Pyrinomonadaceae bacterium]|nr:hypothetical protein [Chloracidobacterium sp.]MBP9934774.1 hypothetical protein [Pyrinomonadaceae bacterium]MBK9438159.1 hypothetical protein [Chloracidobacterium sp.]MBL0240966.1 hypothetical protein [Chloracidobacterium sp.]HQX56333.1 hypothetical protein [Pyrinomonadaceae bacterium]
MNNLIRTSFNVIAVAVLILFCWIGMAFGGIRSAGEYSGVVVFDRWDTCYLYSSTYLMYISEKKKELLRPYVGRSIRIDATEVFQPMNPGDGLITEFNFLGDATVSERLPAVDGLKLTLTEERLAGNSLRFNVEIDNQNRFKVAILKSEIAPTVFGKKIDDDPFSPADGDSEAKITRCNFGSHCGFPRLTYGPAGQLTSDSYSVDVEQGIQQDPYMIYLAGGQKLRYNFYVRVSKGDYDLIIGYGGGVHEGRSLASNIVSFATDVRGNARPEILGETFTKKSSLMSLLFGNYSASSSIIFLNNL